VARELSEEMASFQSGPEMQDRVVRLEVQFEHIVKDLDEIKSDQKALLRELGEFRTTVVNQLASRPTTVQFWTMIGTVAVLALTTVGLVIGGLAALK